MVLWEAKGARCSVDQLQQDWSVPRRRLVVGVKAFLACVAFVEVHRAIAHDLQVGATCHVCLLDKVKSVKKMFECEELRT